MRLRSSPSFVAVDGGFRPSGVRTPLARAPSRIEAQWVTVLEGDTAAQTE